MKALTQKGYDVNYAWGVNGHGQKFGGAILPAMLRWLWRDAPVSTDPNDLTERALRQTRCQPDGRRCEAKLTRRRVILFLGVLAAAQAVLNDYTTAS
jgi:hypothetical protein